MRFNTTLPATLFTEDDARRQKLIGEDLFVQGVIDCVFEDADGELHLVDYKTDRLTAEELADETLAKRVLNEKHSLQLSYYAKAIETIFGRAPRTVKVYSLPLGKTVDIDTY